MKISSHLAHLSFQSTIVDRFILLLIFGLLPSLKLTHILQKIPNVLHFALLWAFFVSLHFLTCSYIFLSFEHFLSSYIFSHVRTFSSLVSIFVFLHFLPCSYILLSCDQASSLLKPDSPLLHPHGLWATTCQDHGILICMLIMLMIMMMIMVMMISFYLQAGCLLVLSLWAAFMLLIHMNKKVSITSAQHLQIISFCRGLFDEKYEFFLVFFLKDLSS